MHSLRDPLVILDPEGAVIEFNQAFTQLFGYELSGGPYEPPFRGGPRRTRTLRLCTRCGPSMTTG